MALPFPYCHCCHLGIEGTLLILPLPMPPKLYYYPYRHYYPYKNYITLSFLLDSQLTLPSPPFPPWLTIEIAQHLTNFLPVQKWRDIHLNKRYKKNSVNAFKTNSFFLFLKQGQNESILCSWVGGCWQSSWRLLKVVVMSNIIFLFHLPLGCVRWQHHFPDSLTVASLKTTQQLELWWHIYSLKINYLLFSHNSEIADLRFWKMKLPKEML